MVTTTKLFNSYINALEKGQLFTAREICSYIYETTNGAHNPMDGTITRMIRNRRAEMHDVDISDKRKSIYVKLAMIVNLLAQACSNLLYKV